MELADTHPVIDVASAEYQRLLGYPRGREIEGRALELADWARAWYATHGRPWVYARQVESVQAPDGPILLDGVAFESSRLRHTLNRAEAHAAILVAVSAGPEAEHEAQKLWTEEKPDEYFFLEMYSSAVVEHLTTMTGARLCAWAEEQGMAILPHYSPGYPDWDIAQQPCLLGLIRRTREHALPGRIGVLDSGMLYPKKSLLAVFGLTRHTDRVRRLTELVPCENCSFGGCQYRRAPYVRTAAGGAPEIGTPDIAAPPLNPDAPYTVNVKALKRWASERLSLQTSADGAIDALFRYEGTTCTNMGRPIAFEYRVKLGPRGQRYPLREQCCGPSPGDDGYTYMCKYISDAGNLMAEIGREKPLLGRPLDDILRWGRPVSSAGCYCDADARQHKWGLVLETIHYALAQSAL